jgi:hypothetical protein
LRRVRFSAGVMAVGATSFALFGTLLGLTLFLQFAQECSPMETGVRLIPLPAGVLIGADGADTLARRFGTDRVIAGGLPVIAALLGRTSSGTPRSPAGWSA